MNGYYIVFDDIDCINCDGSIFISKVSLNTEVRICLNCHGQQLLYDTASLCTEPDFIKTKITKEMYYFICDII